MQKNGNFGEFQGENIFIFFLEKPILFLKKEKEKNSFLTKTFYLIMIYKRKITVNAQSQNFLLNIKFRLASVSILGREPRVGKRGFHGNLDT